MRGCLLSVKTSSVDRQTEHSLPRCEIIGVDLLIEWFKFGCLRLSISRMRCLSSVNCTSNSWFVHPKLSSSPTALPCAGRDSFPQCRGHLRGPVGCAHQVLAEVPQRSTSRVDCTSTPWRLHQNQPFFQPSTMSTCCSRLQLILDVLRTTATRGRPTPRM